MKIYFSPEYTGNVFLKTGQPVMMDTMVMNVTGLVNWLEMRMDLHVEEIPQARRVALYYDAMCRYMKENPKNVMTDSFNLSGLATAKAVLAWRDELRSCGWDFDGEDISERLKVIIGTEKYFRDSSRSDLEARLHIVTDQISFQKLDCSDVEILLPCDVEWMKTQVKELLWVLKEDGKAKISIQKQAEKKDNNLSRVRQLLVDNEKDVLRLDAKDRSLLFYHFRDEWEACQYLSYRGMTETDVWINPDNKQMDNWLTLMNKPRTGSVMRDCLPQLSQLFVMGVGLCAEPLNVTMLVEWLNMPIHPIEGYFRSRLAEMIVAEGGFRNEKCAGLIKEYIDGKFVYLNEEERMLTEDEQNKIREKGRKQRVKKVEVFLPKMVKGKEMLTEDLKRYVSELSGWAKKRIHIMAEQVDNELWMEQLNTVVTMADSFEILLNTIDERTIDYKLIDSWLSSIFAKENYIHTKAEKECRMVVDSPTKLLSVAKNTVWMGLDGDGADAMECAFLYPTEKEALIENGYMRHWNEEDENRYHEYMHMMPFLKTDGRLIIVTWDKKDGEDCMEHPLMVRLKHQIENIDELTVYPTYEDDEMENVEEVENGGVKAELEFDHADLINWPDHLSPTTVSTLIDHPLDYLLNNLLDITPAGKAEMMNVETTMGNVAHAVIAALFAPRGEMKYAKYGEIEERVKNEFEKVYQEVLEGHGAILQLAEHKLKEKLLHEDLQECIHILLDIIRDNRLKVVGCECMVKDDMQLGLSAPKNVDDERDMLGFVDMILEDATGRLVVFDFKWSSSKDYYQNLLKENRSVQLELYRSMAKMVYKKAVDRVAYFIMPRGYLYSKELFEGKRCMQIESQNENNIVKQLRESVLYRKKQLENGIVETNGAFAELQYVRDTEEKNLFPLKEDGGLKKENRFSIYGLFNA